MAAPTRVSSAASAFGSSTSPKTVTGIAVTAGDLITVRAINENGAETFNTPTSTGLTFTARPNVGTSGSTGRCAAWTAPITSSGTISVSLTTAGTTSNWFGIVVAVWRNHGGVGATASVNNTAGTGAPTFNITTTAANSGIDWCTSDFNAIDGTSRVYRSVNGAAATEDNYFRDSVHYAAYAAYHPDAGAAGTYAVGESTPAGQKYSGVAIEILAGAGGGSSFTQSATDTLTVSESLDRTLTLPRAISETLAVSESVVRAVALPRALTDALTVTDAAARSLGHTVSATDTLTITDAATRATQAFSRPVTDALTIAEAVTSPVGRPRAATDALSVTDAAARSALNNPRPVTDTVTVADNATSNGGGTPASTLINLPLTGAGT